MWFDVSGPGADYERLIAFQDPPSGMRGVLVVHSTRLGPGFGGIRRMEYASPEEMVLDACALAHTMSLKCSLAGLDAGGAKAVIHDPGGLELPAVYRQVGRLVEQLQGRWVCGPDLGTGDRELAWVREETRHVNPPGNDAAGMTARGVVAGLRGLMRFLDGDAGFQDCSFLVQGLGAVGLQVARSLLESGASVAGTERDPVRAKAAEEAGVRLVDPGRWVDTPVDVLVPCAVGGLVDPGVARRLQVKAVCGSANNPFSSLEVERFLAERGIIGVPDLVVNAGAVVEGVLTIAKGTKGAVREEAARRVDGFEQTTLRVLEKAAAPGCTPGQVARDEALARIQAAASS